jgi:hypothetical protein
LHTSRNVSWFVFLQKCFVILSRVAVDVVVVVVVVVLLVAAAAADDDDCNATIFKGLKKNTKKVKRERERERKRER